jgi:hypothetical protein
MSLSPTFAPKHRLSKTLGVLALTLGLVGCGGGHRGSGGNAYVTLAWDVADLGNPNKNLYCEDVGAGDVVLTMTNQNTGATYTDTFACASPNYAGTSAYVPSGPYDITISLYGDPSIYGNANTLLESQSESFTLLAGGNDLGVLGFLVNSFVLRWSITVGGAPSSCAAVGAYWVELDVTYPGASQATAFTFPCNDISNREATLGIPMGDYRITWQAFLLDANQRDLLSTVPLYYDVSSSSYQQADLGTAYFAF